MFQRTISLTHLPQIRQISSSSANDFAHLSKIDRHKSEATPSKAPRNQNRSNGPGGENSVNSIYPESVARPEKWPGNSDPGCRARPRRLNRVQLLGNIDHKLPKYSSARLIFAPANPFNQIIN